MATSTPLHRRSVANRLNRTIHSNAQNSPALLDNTDDDLERAERRKSVALRKSLVNLSSGLGHSESIPTLTEDDIKYQVSLSTKLFSENAINIKNVWGLRIIDALKDMVTTQSQQGNLLGMVGSSLEVAGKVYAVRVDSLYEEGMRMMSNLVRQFKQKTPEEDVSNDENQHLEDRRVEPRKKKPKPRIFLDNSKKSTINRDACRGPLIKLESCLFSAKIDPDVGVVGNLFTNKLKMNHSDSKFMLLSNEKTWITGDDPQISKTKKYSFESPQLNNFYICPSFKDFSLDEENDLNDTSKDLIDVILDDDGIPVHELDGSIHDICDNPGQADDSDHIDELQEEVVGNFCENVEYIVDFRPNDKTGGVSLGTSYESTINSVMHTTFGKIKNIWAGPSHWKFKFIRPKTSVFTGRNEHKETSERKKRKKQEFEPYNLEELLEMPSYTDLNVTQRKRKNNVDKTKFHTALLDIGAIEYRKNIEYLFTIPFVKPIPLHKSNNSQLLDGDVSVYNYNNPTDENYLPQNDEDHNSDNDFANDHCMEDVGVAPERQLCDNLVDAPEQVQQIYIQYAQKAKKMDMKKLKIAIWMILTKSKSNEISTTQKIIPMKFSEVYKKLRKILSEPMLSELSCHLAFVAILDLCNQLTLKLEQNDITDFYIFKG